MEKHTERNPSMINDHDVARYIERLRREGRHPESISKNWESMTPEQQYQNILAKLMRGRLAMSTHDLAESLYLMGGAIKGGARVVDWEKGKRPVSGPVVAAMECMLMLRELGETPPNWPIVGAKYEESAHDED